MPPKKRSLLEAAFDGAAKAKPVRPRTTSTVAQQVGRALADNFKGFSEQDLIFSTKGL
jgi:hypothetical protein